jgi:hypothetical protein
MAITGWRGISCLRGIIGLASLRMRALCLTTRWRRLVRYSEPLPRRASKLGCHTIRARCP